jgi:peptidoglycan DL-endopeptidase CwlO
MVRRILAGAVPVVAVLAVTVPARAATTPQAAAYAWATTQDGKPFLPGGTGPQGFDCSGLVYAAYRHAGITLPRDTYGMVHSRLLAPISKTQAQRGDLAFYGPPGDPEHVAMVDVGDVVFSAYRPGKPAGWSVSNRWWFPDQFFRVQG